MKSESCAKANCPHLDERGLACGRYGKLVRKVNCCGILAGRTFHKPFSRKGLVKKIEYRNQQEERKQGV